MSFCSAPLFYSKHISPCVYEPVSAVVIFVYIVVAWLIRRRYRLQQEATSDPDTEALLQPEARGAAPSPSRIRRGAAKWQYNLGSAQVWIIGFISLAQLCLVLGGKNGNSESTAIFYVVSTALLAMAWLFQLVYLNHCSPSLCYRDAVLVLFYLFNLANDIYLMLSRVQIIYFPSSFDPVFLDSTPLVDLCFIGLRCFITLLIFLISLRYHGVHFPGPIEEPEPSAFSGFFKKIARIFPFVWPRKNPFLQALIFCCMVLLVAGRWINLLVPIQYKRLVDALTRDLDNGQLRFPLFEMLAFVGLKFLQGNAGIVYSLQATLWIPVEQFTTREVSLRVFQHLHGLSLRWHLNRKTGEVLRVMDRGTTAITSLLSYMFFDIFPVLVDIAIAVVYFVVAFDIYFGMIVFATMAMYLVVTVLITEWRTQYRRKMIDLDNKTNTKAVDSLLNFETVKYYGNEGYELNSYKDRIVAYQKADWKSQLSMRVLNLSQGIVITIGLVTGGLLCVDRVVKGSYAVGDFVLFIAYLQQLYGPLNYFGSYYRALNQNFVDQEKMFQLLNQEPEVVDADDATELLVTKGHVVFENVCFTYEPKKALAPTLKNISFEIPPGSTVALCGASGGGKSSIMRLLFRFYNISSGRILIDGQDISKVTQKSLRKAIGVVPQDTILFNDTLNYNIRYGNVEAADSDVVHAAEMAQIHEKIMEFADKYDTQVGERGLRLSGGEKQRIAIARTLLKDPHIILLDEATSALDTNTETLIQKALNKMTREKTSLIIAHRLSTIIHADLILVLKDGEIAERGTHEQLLAMGERNKNAIYYNLWMKQLTGETE